MRTLLLVVSATASFVIVAVGVQGALERSDVPAPRTNVDLAVDARVRLRRLHVNGWRDTAPRILYLADSTAISEPPLRSVRARLRRLLLRPRWYEDHAPSYAALVFPGLWALDAYFLADEIASLEPTIVVLTLNASSFGKQWMLKQAHPEMAAWLDPRRIPSALRLPLGRTGATADRLLFYNALEAAGSTARWHDVRAQQARLGAIWDRLGDDLDDSAGTAAVPDADREANQHRFRVGQADRLRARFGAFIAGVQRSNATLVLLAATLDRLAEAGVASLVVLSPINLDVLELRGVSRGEGFGRSLATVDRVVTEHGGVFLDLHDLLPGAGFRDEAGHFAFDGSIDAPAVVAAEIELGIVKVIASGARR